MKVASTIFLLAENRLLRESLSRLLRRKSDISVVGESGSTAGTIQQVADSDCEILLLDNATLSRTNPNLVVEILEAVPDLKIILIGVDDNEESFLQAVRSGAVGYLVREASALDVLAAVRAVARGEAVCPPQLTLALFRHFANQRRGVPYYRSRVELGLTRRQHQLVSFVAKGLTNKEIANTLHLSEQTVKNHMHRILRQVNAEDRYQAVETIRSFGLLS
jgi:DNA-binding NarL/FixJ family response regulator